MLVRSVLHHGIKNIERQYLFISTRPFGILGIGILASALALLASVSAPALQKIYFVLQSLYFCLSKFYMKKISMVKYFWSTLADLPGSFSQYLEQLFCKKSVSACFWRKKLHSRRYLRSFKNTQGWKLYFPGFQISDNESHQQCPSEITTWKFSVIFKPTLRNLDWNFCF